MTDRAALIVSTNSALDLPISDTCSVLPALMSHSAFPFSPHAARSQMMRIAVWAFIQYAMPVDGATIHVTGPEERQVEFGDGTTSFAVLSGGEGFINSTVTLNAPDFATMEGALIIRLYQKLYMMDQIMEEKE